MTILESECILWGGYISDQGYGAIPRNYKSSKKAHVDEWEKIYGPVPSGLVLDHLCRNRACVNPKHLEPVTPKVNTLRGFGPTAVNSRKTECPKGHPLSGDNLTVNRLGHRVCRICQRNHSLAYQARQREQLKNATLLAASGQPVAQGADALDAARYEYLLDCDYIAAKEYLQNIDEGAWKAGLRSKHDWEIAQKGSK